MIISISGGCGDISKEAFKPFVNDMTDTERSKVLVQQTLLGDKITLFDEEVGDNYEIYLLKSASYQDSKKASFYLIQGTTFNPVQLKALKDYLDAHAPQTLLAVINTGKDRDEVAKANRDFVEEAEAYQNFLTHNMLGWMCENYNINTKDICLVGYNAAGYFAAYSLHTHNSIPSYLIISPQLHKRTDKLDIFTREETFFKNGNSSLAAKICLLRSEEDFMSLPFTKTDEWINTLRERNYKDLIISNELLPGVGHYVMDCEALLRGICYFEEKEYGDNEAACIAASKSMTQTERDSIIARKLSSDHEFYNEVVGIDPDTPEYIKEIEIYDEEIGDRFIVHVSLPPNYDETKRYPLVLMTDGIWRLSDHPELRKLMFSGEIENIILASVGYPNGYDYFAIRERDLLRQPDLYLQFLTENLMPYLYDNFRVDTAQTALTGHSYGGYWGLYALFHSDTMGKDIFKYYYIGSPSFQASTNSVVIKDFENRFSQRKKTLDCYVYITVGGDEESSFIDLIENNLSQIQKTSYEGLTLEYEVIENYDHNTVFKPSIKNALIKFYGSKKP